MGLLSVIEDISVFKHEYMDMGVPALVGQGEVGEVKLRERVDSGNEQMANWPESWHENERFEPRFSMRTSIRGLPRQINITDSHLGCSVCMPSPIPHSPSSSSNQWEGQTKAECPSRMRNHHPRREKTMRMIVSIALSAYMLFFAKIRFR